MRRKRAVVIYYSLTGNTRKLALAIAKTLKSRKDISKVDIIDTTMFRHRQKSKKPKYGDTKITVPESVLKKIGSADLLAVGSGIYFWNAAKPLLKTLSMINRVYKKDACIFFSSGAMPVKHMMRDVKTVLHNKGYNVKGMFCCKGEDRHPLWRRFNVAKGHPDALDIKHAEMFARKII